MRLLDVYQTDSYGHLYRLLAERTPEQSISHRRMPTWEEHVAFVGSRPYQHWYLVEVEQIVGAIYLSKAREIGVGIFNGHRGNGYGKAAVKMLMEKHPGRFLANINPLNHDSIRMFTGLGFGLVQHTYSGPTGNPHAR